MASRVVGDRDQYTVYRTLGEGMFCRAKLVLDSTTSQWRCLKVWKPTARKCAEAEHGLLRQLSHPNIIKSFGITQLNYPGRGGKLELHTCTLLEVAENFELFDYIAETGVFEEDLARTVLSQLFDGIAHCHSRFISHRDLKPEQVLFDRDFVLKLVDFGSSQQLNSNMWCTDNDSGSRGYLAPEIEATCGRKVASDWPGFDAGAADVWAAGVTAFIVLCGFPPFRRASNRCDWYKKFVQSPDDYWKWLQAKNIVLSDTAHDLINRMLCVDPKQRITFKEILQHPFFATEALSQSEYVRRLSARRDKVAAVKQKKKDSSPPSPPSVARVAAAVPSSVGLSPRTAIANIAARMASALLEKKAATASDAPTADTATTASATTTAATTTPTALPDSSSPTRLD